eukprot:2257392-Alexandrium_andersonii.AAC.1
MTIFGAGGCGRGFDVRWYAPMWVSGGPYLISDERARPARFRRRRVPCHSCEWRMCALHGFLPGVTVWSRGAAL